MSARIVVASPVQQTPEVLELFLEFIERMNTKELHIDYLFGDDNVDPASRGLLEAFRDRHPNTDIMPAESGMRPLYVRDGNTHHWNVSLVHRVAAMKDRMIEFALERGYDALFLADSDLLVHPDALCGLWEAKRDLIASVFWTRWRPDSQELPQVWITDEYSFETGSLKEKGYALEGVDADRPFLEQLRVPGIYEVGGLGACTLISREAMQRGVRFRGLPNVSLWGEDRHFCIRAAALGLRLFADTRYPAHHLYRHSDLAGVDAYRASVFGVAGGITVTLCLIVRNEENVLARCLTSARGIADEIVIVDTGSDDRTRDIAASFTPHVYDFEWIDDFAAARNYAFARATQDYILWLDADDMFEEEDRRAMIALKQSLPPDTDSVMMPYTLAVDGNGRPSISIRRNRLVRRACGFKWIGAVHEYLEVHGSIAQSEIAVVHRKERAYGDRNLRIYRSRLASGESFSPRDLYYFANELRDHACYEEAAERYEAFLAGKRGWVEDNIAACLKQADCYAKLQERERQLFALLRSLEYDKPRAESCCRLGAFFMEEGKHAMAAHWFETAVEAGAPPQAGTAVDHSAWTWLPNLQLCVCYDRMGLYEKANACNELALAYYPNHPSMLYNRDYLQRRLHTEEAN